MKKSGSEATSAGQRLVERARYLDKEGRASIPLSLLLVLLFEMRGYVAAIISLTFAEDRTRLLKLFYTSSEQFGLMLLVGLPALIVLLATTFAGEDERNWANVLMRFAQPLLLLSLIVDATLILWMFIEQHGAFSFGRAGIIFGWFICGWYLVNSRRWRFYRRHLASRY
ncbi:DUF2919 family protein [Idiomarina abyssalis]|jgi:hypothetical protein|uniref:DUF2919 family protein n=1 Tax=Idiomarina abyssalis TaxID=86102 RepID=A0A8I1G9E8_9GAMM|nr:MULTISPECIES: DUF2919 family protein [Idiomarina]MAO69363.1 hypothetical protein [Idiomarina sp.]MBJ7267017.1 DUF2919 family protein [Idiomarina abyssalis]MBJ7273708.1 DUF2919 family protein [Idiomarina abyssalis]MBJ7316045.1 DUF2919 family protein [Idiomarina abyssalis]